MTLLLALLFLAIPILELYVLVQVADMVGVGNALGLLVVISIVGAMLTKRAGLGVLRRLQRTVNEGRVPSRELVDGFLVLLAGAMLLTPGFVTDAFAVLLLLPPTRAGLRNVLIRVFRSRSSILVAGTTAGTVFGSRSRGRQGDDVWDAQSWEADRAGHGDDPDAERGELGP